MRSEVDAGRARLSVCLCDGLDGVIVAWWGSGEWVRLCSAAR